MIRNSVIPAVFLVLEKGKKVLLLERLNTGWNDGMYTLPSGHVEKGESPTEAIIREVYEEVGVKVSRENISLKTVLYRKSRSYEERVDFIFTTTNWENKPSNKEPEKSKGLVWSDKKNLPSNTIDFIKQIIISEETYIELGYEL